MTVDDMIRALEQCKINLPISGDTPLMAAEGYAAIRDITNDKDPTAQPILGVLGGLIQAAQQSASCTSAIRICR